MNKNPFNSRKNFPFTNRTRNGLTDEKASQLNNQFMQAICAGSYTKRVPSRQGEPKITLYAKKLNKVKPDRFAGKTRLGKMPLDPECK